MAPSESCLHNYLLLMQVLVISVVQPTQNLSSVLSVSTVMIEGAELTSV